MRTSSGAEPAAETGMAGGMAAETEMAAGMALTDAKPAAPAAMTAVSPIAKMWRDGLSEREPSTEL